jgi:hypothetical protein
MTGFDDLFSHAVSEIASTFAGKRATMLRFRRR